MKISKYAWIPALVSIIVGLVCVLAPSTILLGCGAKEDSDGGGTGTGSGSGGTGSGSGGTGSGSGGNSIVGGGSGTGSGTTTEDGMGCTAGDTKAQCVQKLLKEIEERSCASRAGGASSTADDTSGTLNGLGLQIQSN